MIRFSVSSYLNFSFRAGKRSLNALLLGLLQAKKEKDNFEEMKFCRPIRLATFILSNIPRSGYNRVMYVVSEYPQLRLI